MIPKQDIILEQKFMILLSLLLILFNDPFCGITILYPNIVGFLIILYTKIIF